MTYWRFSGIECNACNKAHNLAVAETVHVKIPHEFVCPNTSETVRVERLPFDGIAKTVLDAIPDDCIEAKEC